MKTTPEYHSAPEDWPPSPPRAPANTPTPIARRRASIWNATTRFWLVGLMGGTLALSLPWLCEKPPYIWLPTFIIFWYAACFIGCGAKN